MTKFGKFHCKYLHLVYTKSVCGPLFHTTRNPVLPNFARGENYMEPDYLQCLRPAAMKVADVPTLAGDPRSPSYRNPDIKPEIAKKWNQLPSHDIHKEWSKFSVFY